MSIQLDSIKLAIPGECCSINLEEWDKHTIQKAKVIGIFDSPGSISTKYSLSSEIPQGIKSLIFASNTLQVELSAKVLGSDYLQGISETTIERVFENIEKVPSIKLSKDSFLSASVLRVDCTKTIEIEKKSIPGVLQSLKLAHSNGKFLLSDVKGESIIFKHMGRSIRERVIFYDKKIELSRASNKGIRGLLTLPGDKDLLRVESNISTYKDIRERFKVRSERFQGISLMGVLQSKENPILYLYDKIMTLPENDSFLFYKSEIEQYRALKPSEFVDTVGYKTLINNFRNIEEIRDYLLNQLYYNKSIVSKMIKKINLLKLKTSINKDSNVLQVVELIRQKIAV